MNYQAERGVGGAFATLSTPPLWRTEWSLELDPSCRETQVEPDSKYVPTQPAPFRGLVSTARLRRA